MTRHVNLRHFVVPAALSAPVILVYGVPRVTAGDGGPTPAGIDLELPGAYIATSPGSRLLDALSLLSNPQSIAFIVSLITIIVSIAVFRSRPGRRRRRGAIALVVAISAVAAIEAAVVFLPRPMAALKVQDPDIVRVDFHSHTGASHDVRKSFSAEDNRDWHRGGGFDVAWISDHVKFDGAVAAARHNPRLAGEGTSLLSAVEGRYHRIMSTIMLGLTEADTALLNRRGNLLPGTPSSGRPPVTIVALPNRNLDSVTAESLDSLPRFVAIELVDAAPRGLGQLDREEARIRDLARARGLVLVAASNNHGWGRAVAAWNLLRVPGWQSLAPDSVGRLIENQLRSRDTAAVEVIRRTRPALHGVAVAAVLPVIVYQIVGSLTTAERFVWLAWIWGAWIVWLIVRGRHASRESSHHPGAGRGG